MPRGGMGMRRGRSAGRRTRRRMRRRRRRRVMLVGGLVAFGAYKFSTRDAKRIEEQSGVPPEEMTDEELERSMAELGIEKQLRGADDQEEGAAAAPAPAAAAAGGDTTIADLERLAQLRDQGVLTEQEFEAKKQQILGL